MTLTKDFEPKYVGGYPTNETAEAMFDEYDYQAAVQFYIWGYSYLNNLGLEKGLASMGGDERSIYQWDKLLQTNHVLMTANSRVVYNFSRHIDISKEPVVIEIPPGVLGMINDLGTHAFSDLGNLGPDQAKGGKYLVIARDYDREIPDGFFVVRAKYSDRVIFMLRTFPTPDEGLEGAVAHAQKTKWYYLSEKDNPPPTTFVRIGTRPFSQEWPKDERAFEWFAEIVNMDRLPNSALPHLGNMRRLGIERGKPFNPDARAQAIFKRAAKTAEATVLSMAFHDRIKDLAYEDRTYKTIFYNDDPEFFPKDADGNELYEEMEARAGGWHQLAMQAYTLVPPKPGTGGFYVSTYRDADGNFLMGQHTYKLHIPADVPVKQFWQMPVYEVSTRSYMNTDQKRGALSPDDDLQSNDDGSVDLYFAPELPEGASESNWIKTKPGEGWFVLPRLYAPLEPILDKTWRWNDIERIATGESVQPTGSIPEIIGGYPTNETAEAMFEEYDYQAAVQFYVWGYAYLNNLGMDKGLARMGGDERSFYIWNKRVQPQHVLMTANSEVVYIWPHFVDLSKGPVVFEVPPRVRGHFWDLSTRAYSDVGDIGPDKSKGGKYLIVSSDYQGEIPEGYFVVRSEHSNRITLGMRAFPDAEGGVEEAVQHAAQTKWYYLSEADNPPENSYVKIGDRPFSQDWPRDERAFEWLAEAFNMDKVPASGLAHMGNMRRLGIEQGKPFNPDERAKRILKLAAKTGEAMVLSMAFNNRLGLEVYDNRQYGDIFFSQNPTFIAEGYEEVEERAGAWHQLVGNVATQIPAKPGTGGMYMSTFRDKDGEWLNGSNTYKLHIQAKVPVKQFWQIPVYDVTRRAMINNGQRSTISGTDNLTRNADGSVDIYFAPQLPQGVSETNWIKTTPEEGWFTLPRLYAPEQPILDKTWRWNDFELVERGAVPPKPGGDGDVVYQGGYPT